jgi:O-succinylbenzoic acid--CoA ligase
VPAEPLLAVHARRHPDAEALVAPGERLTWAQLHARAGAAAATLAQSGAGAGDRVAIALPAGIDFAVALHATLLLGAAVLPVDLRLAPGERAARAAAARHLVDAPLREWGQSPSDAPLRERGQSPSVGGGDGWGQSPAVALAVHTSGTTGAPKLVELTWGNVTANALGSALALGFDRAERWLCPLPLTHVGGLMVLLRSLVYGTAAHLLPAPFDAERANHALHRDGVTLASLVPTMLARMLDAGLRRPPRLRAVLLGGAPSDPALLARAAAAGIPVAQTYGLTEACSQVCTSAPGEPETAGWPLPGVAVELEPDGEILVSGPTVAGGGTLRTGDLGRLDERGRLTVVGRKADTIVTGGENVAPAEVEAVLLAHPAVADAGVFARPDAEWGEAVTARVVLREAPAASAEDLRAFCAQRLARFKVPKAVELADAPLPRTASGKLLRRELASEAVTSAQREAE